MKKNIYLIVIITFLGSISASAQMCKRKGIIDCPGLCGRFTDKDGDSICDFSPRSKPVEIVKAESTKPKAADTTSKATENKSNNTSSIAAKSTQQATETVNQTPKESKGETAIDKIAPQSDYKEQPILSQAQPAEKMQDSPEPPDEKPYALIEMTGLTLFLYFLSVLLVKAKAYKKVTHRKIWNVILLATFLMSGILGLVLVVQINYGVAMDWYMQFMKLHVEFGIAMALISIIHVIWHTSYYMNMLRKKKK